ncbi:MAG TPA: flagellar motor switch protein FliM [Clostridiales bacterium]|nr:flagellar motor switch protein FliM [Clostridiales bacterium]
MAEILSQQQIDEMLQQLMAGNVDIENIEKEKSKKIKEYDFRSPKRFTREQLKLLNSIFDNFAWLFCLQVSSLLRVSCEMEIVAIEEQQFHEYNNALNDSVLVGNFSLLKGQHGEDKPLLVEISREISFSMIDRLLGGSGYGYNVQRDYTEIEIAILEYLFKQMANMIRNAWQNYVEVVSELIGIETNARLLQTVSPDETVAIIIFDMVLNNDLTGKMSICIPAETLESVFKVFKLKHTRQNKNISNTVDDSKRDHIFGALKTSDLVLSAYLGKTEITLKDLLNLQVGDIITLNTQIKEDPVMIEIEDVPWYQGKLGISKKNYAIKISKVLKK